MNAGRKESYDEKKNSWKGNKTENRSSNCELKQALEVKGTNTKA